MTLEEARQRAARRSAGDPPGSPEGKTSRLRPPHRQSRVHTGLSVSRLAIWEFRTCRSFRRMSAWPALP